MLKSFHTNAFRQTKIRWPDGAGVFTVEIGRVACPPLQRNEEDSLKTGKSKVDHLAHANPIACKFSEGESEKHRRYKMEIFEALSRAPGVRDVALERSEGIRPDVSAIVNGVPVAVEVEITSLSLIGYGT